MNGGKRKMMFKSKKTIVGVAVAGVLFVLYVLYALSGSAPASGDLKGWGLLMLQFITVCIVAEIITHVAVHAAFAASIAAKEKDKDKATIKNIIRSEMTDDEMDSRIMLKSSHVGYGVVGAGFVLTLVMIVFLDVSAVLALNILLGMFFLSVIADSCVSIFLYEKGENAWTPGRDCE